ncbi:MAG: TrkA C-terminal domain-containing protein [Candidatus Thermoplasmatota archaeon]|nr:TrkA C-terminal domain-containing protein [Candidatus Thermoplasmatota archaeon]
MKVPKWKEVEFEEIEYKPTSIKELLIEMKNTSELMVDLAYSAILFNNSDIAEEVRYLEVHMEKLNYQMRIMAMLAARDKEDAEKLSGILQMAEAAKTISNAAGDIVKLLSVKLKHPLLPRLLKESDEMIRKMTIEENSAVVGVSLSKLHVASETGVRIIALRRGKRWLYNPKDITLNKGDVVIGVGPEKGLDQLNKFFKGEIGVLE